jgi:hypothetical protein
MPIEVDKEWWFPVLCDDAYFARLRNDYPEDARLSDEELHEKYNEGLKYQQLWDHTGDAYEQFEKLADDWVSLRKDAVELIEKMRKQLERKPHEDGMADQEFHDEVLIPALNRFSYT